MFLNNFVVLNNEKRDMMNKKYYILIFLSILLAQSVMSAETPQINRTQAFDWLYSEMNRTNWNDDTDIIALSILALGPESKYDLDEGIEKLEERNWANPYESSLAILALYKAGVDVDEDIQELIDQQQKAQDSGSWLIQMRNLNDKEASCNLFYNEDVDFRIINNTITEGPCSGDTWVDFESCIALSEGIGVHEQFDVDCTNADPSLIFRDNNNEFFILDETSPFNIDNSCFEQSGSCDCRNSLYASWVLNEVGNKSQVWTFPWMSSFCSEDGENINNALLYIISNEEVFADKLKDSFGGSSWENDEYITAVGYMALSKSSSNSQITNEIKEWLAVTQRGTGSWRDDPEKTAMVLYALYSRGQSFSFDVSDDNDYGTSSFCGNSILEFGEDCDGSSNGCGLNEVCSSCQCVTSNQTSCTVNDGCIEDSDCTLGPNGVCTSLCECDYRCTSSDDCLSGQVCEFQHCVAAIDDGDGISEDDNGSNFLTYIWILLGIIVALGAAYLAYLKFVKHKKIGKPKKTDKDFESSPILSRKYPSAKEAIQKPQQIKKEPEPKSSGDDFLERRLDESIRKAKELLKKK